MRTAREVKVIPPTTGRLAPIVMGPQAKRRVAAYARVSTDNEEQLSSYEAQVDYYTRHIQSNSAWDFVEVYTDEGISATSTKKRDGFNRMIADALAGKIDLIVTKSVSRFARNTVDTLTTVRQLKEKGVEVFFEKENIYTMDSKGELLITIMSSLAQEESRSLSENVTWGQRKRLADGKVRLPYGHFLGYEKGEDGLPKIVEKEARVVRLIYKLFLEGRTPSGIAKHLTMEGIPTPGGKQKWQPTTVQSILTNEKFKGDAVLQKTFSLDFLTKKRKVNEGEVPQYYVENSHEAIITPEVFELVQEEFRRRKAAGMQTSAINYFASRIVCGDCGGFYGRKVWHSTTKYANTVWQCNKKFTKKEFCTTPHLKETTLKRAFTEAFNSLIQNKTEILVSYETILLEVTELNKLDKEREKIDEQSTIIQAAVEKLVSNNARSPMSQKEYNNKYNSLANRYNDLQKRSQEISSQMALSKARRNQMSVFIGKLKEQEGLLTEFDESLWCATVNGVVVKSSEEVIFQFKDGTVLPWKI